MINRNIYDFFVKNRKNMENEECEDCPFHCDTFQEKFGDNYRYFLDSSFNGIHSPCAKRLIYAIREIFGKKDIKIIDKVSELDNAPRYWDCLRSAEYFYNIIEQKNNQIEVE